MSGLLAGRAQPARLSMMLGWHSIAVNRPRIGRISADGVSRRRHDGPPRPRGADPEGAVLDSGGPGPGLCPERARARCARIFRMTGGIMQGCDQAEPTPTMGTRQHVDPECPVHQGRPAPGVIGNAKLPTCGN